MDHPLIRLKDFCIVCSYAQCLYELSNARINAATEIIGLPNECKVINLASLVTAKENPPLKLIFELRHS